jgi:hypothetical protein
VGSTTCQWCHWCRRWYCWDVWGECNLNPLCVSCVLVYRFLLAWYVKRVLYYVGSLLCSPRWR